MICAATRVWFLLLYKEQNPRELDKRKSGWFDSASPTPSFLFMVSGSSLYLKQRTARNEPSEPVCSCVLPHTDARQVGFIRTILRNAFHEISSTLVRPHADEANLFSVTNE